MGAAFPDDVHAGSTTCTCARAVSVARTSGICPRVISGAIADAKFFEHAGIAQRHDEHSEQRSYYTHGARIQHESGPHHHDPNREAIGTYIAQLGISL